MPAYRYPWEYQPEELPLIPTPLQLPAPPDGVTVFDPQAVEQQAEEFVPQPLLPDNISHSGYADLTALGSMPGRQSLLEQHRERAERMRKQNFGGHTSVLGSILGSIGGVLNSAGARYLEDDADAGQKALMDKADSTRSAFARAIQGVGAQQASNLANLSGDAQLMGFGNSALRGLTLEQAERRLTNAEQGEGRRTALAQQRLGLEAWKAQQDAAAKLKAVMQKKAGGGGAGTKVGTTPKLATIPAGEASSIGQMDAAMSALNDLGAAFKASGAEGIGGRIEAAMPWDSKSTQFEDQVLAAAQAVGTILEGGKLAAGDEVKYRKMLPAAGDSRERAAAKISNVLRLLEQAKSTKIQGLGAAGYNVQGFQQQPQRSPADTDLTKPVGATPAISSEDAEALAWVRANPNDPDAATVRELLQKKGIRP